MLWLRYDASGPFSSRRRLSGKGRFASSAPILLDYDVETGSYTALSSTPNEAMRETTCRLIVETGALTSIPKTAAEIARAVGLMSDGRASGGARRRIQDALRDRDGIRTMREQRSGRVETRYALPESVPGQAEGTA